MKSNALLTLKEICEYAGFSENTLRRMVKKEGLPAKKIGGTWVSDKGKIDKWRLESIGV